MQAALHREIAERKEKSAPERRRMLSKMTSDEQEATDDHDGLLLPALINVRKVSPKRLEPVPFSPGRNWWEIEVGLPESVQITRITSGLEELGWERHCM